VVETSVSLERTPDGRRLAVAARFAVGPETAWDALVDTDCWPAWGPSVTAVDCADRRIDAGSEGRVRLPGGVWVPFRVTHLSGRRWTWRVARVPATGHRVETIDGRPSPDATAGDESEACRVVFEVPVLAAGYVPVCRRALGDLAALLEE